MKILDQVLAAPVWLFTLCMYPLLPTHHRWKKRKQFFPLADWTTSRTNLVRQFDFFMWLGIISLDIGLALL